MTAKTDARVCHTTAGTAATLATMIEPASTNGTPVVAECGATKNSSIASMMTRAVKLHSR
jgi:hypothetical protein